MVTREDIIEKLSEKTLLEDAAVDSKIQNILSNPTLISWIEELPVIPDLLLTLLTLLGFQSLEELVTQNFVWEYWSKALVEEHNDFPDVTEIAELAELGQWVDRFGAGNLGLPIDNIDALRRICRDHL